MNDFSSGSEQYGLRHELRGKATKADLRRRISVLEADLAARPRGIGDSDIAALFDERDALRTELSEALVKLEHCHDLLAEKQLALDSLERDRDLLWEELERLVAQL